MNRIILVLVLVFLSSSCVKKIDYKENKLNNDNIYQYSSMNSLLRKDYIGELKVKELKEKGDFGIGTLNMVDGEMIILDAVPYQVLTTGEINIISDEKLSPFAVIKFFNPDTSFKLPKNISLDSAKSLFSQITKNVETPLGIKIEGTFKSIISRSVNKVGDKKLSLAELIENQTKFNFEDRRATIVGFWFPQYFDGLNFPGYHFHILLNDFSGGGHLLECIFDDVIVEIDYAYGFRVDL